MTTETSKQVAAKRILAQYLSELTAILGRDINLSSLVSIENIEKIREQASCLSNETESAFSIKFDGKLSERFGEYISNLRKANDSEVYIWTDKSNLCGPCKINSIGDFDISFPFDVNPEGVVVFLATDLCDKLLFDFSIDSDNQKILEVESQGKHWPLVEY
jgi:hypothetical protein